jgi:hypothetical protein
LLTEADFLRGIASVGLEVIAEALGISVSEASRKVSGKTNWTLAQICKLIPVIGIEARVTGTKDTDEYVRALETVLKHKLSESEW